jgi:hypothetical protein
MTTKFENLSPEVYFPRIDQYQSWYDNKAVDAKRKYIRSKVLSALSAILIPVILNVDTFPYIGNIEEYSNIVATILGLLVSILIALENVLKYKDQWINYRSTEQFIVREKILLLSKSGPYLDLEEDKAYHRFIGVCEDAIQNENQATLNILTREESANKK